MNSILNRHTDATLVQLVGEGQQGALAEIYRRHGGSVFGLARRLLRDPNLAEEIVQEVMLRLWNQPEKFDASRGSLQSYLMAHTHGRSIDFIRSESSRRIREEREGRLTLEHDLSLEDEVWSLVLADHLQNALAELTDDESKAIELAYLRGYTYREIARMLDTPEGTIKSRIRSGLQRLSRLLAASDLAPMVV